ncbi:MAG TPA: nucleotidyltransferase domain-containing protein [Burkholderiaceae bacterium]|nr:nucleotidyltransferase domain-containing protein [Burkholderiaceae bacterium]
MTRSTRLDPATLDATRRFRQRLDRDFDVAGVIVFGSRARSTHRPDSDADVAVLLRGAHERPFLATKLALSDVAYDVLLDTGVNISPLPIWMDEWEHPDDYANPQLLKNIAREGVRV